MLNIQKITQVPWILIWRLWRFETHGLKLNSQNWVPAHGYSSSSKQEQRTGAHWLVCACQTNHSSLLPYLHWSCLHQTPHVTLSLPLLPRHAQTPFLHLSSFHSRRLWEINITNVSMKERTSVAIYLLRLFMEFSSSKQYKWHFTWEENPSSNATEGKFLPFSTMSAFTVNGTSSLMRTALLKLNRTKPAQRESRSQNSVKQHGIKKPHSNA